MTEQAMPRPARFPWLIPVGLFALLIAGLIALFLFAREAGKSEEPPQPPAFVAPELKTYTAFDVEGNAGGKLKVSSGRAEDASSSDLDLPAGTRVWFMEPAEAADIKPPLKVNVIGIPNEVRNYTLRMMVFAAPEGPITFEEPFIPLFDGFFGHEPSRDLRERVVLSVLLESFDGRNGVTSTANGPGTLYVDPGAPVRLVRSGSPAEIQPGDRIAIHDAADGSPDTSKGVLVLVGGAK
jgi:hypothetical protein